MASVEELVEKEKLYKEEIALLKAQYKEMGERVDAKLNSSTTSPQAQVAILPDEDLVKMKKDIAETEKRIDVLENNVTEWVEDIRKEVQTLSEKVEEDRQYSRFNSAILHGFKNCNLHLNDIDFIFYIANELNRMFPSLNGKILPAHIDEAHVVQRILTCSES